MILTGHDVAHCCIEADIYVVMFNITNAVIMMLTRLDSSENSYHGESPP